MPARDPADTARSGSGAAMSLDPSLLPAPTLRRVLRSYERRLKTDIETLTRMVDEYPDHDWWDERLTEAKAERRALVAILRAGDTRRRRPRRPDPLRQAGRTRNGAGEPDPRRRDLPGTDGWRTDGPLTKDDVRGRNLRGTEGRRRALGAEGTPGAEERRRNLGSGRRRAQGGDRELGRNRDLAGDRELDRDRELSEPPEIPDVIAADRSGIPAPLAGWLTRLSFAQLGVVMVAVAEELWHRDPPDRFDSRPLVKGTMRLMTTVRAVFERGDH